MSTPLYNHLNRPVERDEMTLQQRAIMDATEAQLGVEIAFASDLPGEIGELLADLTRRGWWARITTPFVVGELWWVGLTPLGAGGWNGTPDHHVGDATFRGALYRAIMLAFMDARQRRAPDVAQESLL